MVTLPLAFDRNRDGVRHVSVATKIAFAAKSVKEAFPIERSVTAATAKRSRDSWGVRIWIVGAGRLSGAYRQSPLFDVAGRPIVPPSVLTPEELKALKNFA